jgi:hypothetical protein
VAVVHSNLLWCQHLIAAATWLQNLAIGGGYFLIQILSTLFTSFSMEAPDNQSAVLKTKSKIGMPSSTIGTGLPHLLH